MIAQQKKNTGILCRSGFGKQAVLETPLQRMQNQNTVIY